MFRRANKLLIRPPERRATKKPLLAEYRVTDSERVHRNVIVHLRSQRSLQHAELEEESEKKIRQKATDSKVDQYKNIVE